MLKYTALVIIILPIFADQSNGEQTDLPPDVELHTTLFKQRALEQVLDVLNNAPPCKCLKYAGKKLIACLDYASKEEVRDSFAKMSYQARIDYLLRMNLIEYKHFLDAFETEEHWSKTLEHLPHDQQKLLPQTILEQLIMIRNTWLSCYERKVGVYSRGAKDPQAHDIAAWRNKALDGYEHMLQHCPELWQWLDERFMEQKINLLHELKKQHASTKRGAA